MMEDNLGRVTKIKKKTAELKAQAAQYRDMLKDMDEDHMIATL
jgi:hypothetical protein